MNELRMVSIRATLRTTLHPCPKSLAARFLEFLQDHAERDAGLWPEHARPGLDPDGGRLADLKHAWWTRTDLNAAPDLLFSAAEMRCGWFKHAGRENGHVLLEVYDAATCKEKLDRDRPPCLAKALAVIEVDKGGSPTAVLRLEGSTRNVGEERRYFRVEAVCDINRDRYAELVFMDEQYAGSRYSVCEMATATTSWWCENVHAASD